ncbi:hypothetical protein JW868_01315 [Candidatus Woesearchaeota archaeon]|nr:hypothetical protein [Candidatus Woesearchaeota archaeon]
MMTLQRKAFVQAIQLLLVFLLFLISACDNNGKWQPPETINYHVGTEGIIMEVFKANSLDTVYEGDEVQLAIKFYNKGAHDILCPSEYAVLGINYDSFYLKYIHTAHDYENLCGPIRIPLYTVAGVPVPLSLGTEGVTPGILYPFWIYGKSEYFPTGEITIIDDIMFKVNDIFGQRINPMTSVVFSLCYPYSTFFADSMCIDKSQYALDPREQVCYSETKNYESQGAPLAITKVKPKLRKVDVPNPEGTYRVVVPSFDIWIRNLGSGRTFDRDVVEDLNFEEACQTQTLDDGEWDIVNVEATLGAFRLNCTPEKVRLYDREARVRCSADENDFTSVASNYQRFYEKMFAELKSKQDELQSKFARVMKNLVLYNALPTSTMPSEDQIYVRDSLNQLNQLKDQLKDQIKTDGFIEEEAVALARQTHDEALSDASAYSLLSTSNYFSLLQVKLTYMYVITDSQTLSIKR